MSDDGLTPSLSLKADILYGWPLSIVCGHRSLQTYRHTHYSLPWFFAIFCIPPKKMGVLVESDLGRMGYLATFSRDYRSPLERRITSSQPDKRLFIKAALKARNLQFSAFGRVPRVDSAPLCD